MKLNGILGKGSGKLGSSVFAISGGAQIVREHNPKVSNPNTEAQVEQRAKLKLLSQLAADLAPALFFKKKGLVSARNQFIAANMSLCTYDNEEASVSIYQLLLSPSSSVLPNVTAIQQSNSYKCQLEDKPATSLEGVFYIGIGELYAGVGEPRLRVVGIDFETEEGADGDYVHNSTWGRIEYVFAVGIKKVDGAKKIIYDDYNTGDATNLATLSVLLNAKDYAANLTMSKGAIAENSD